MFTPLPIKALLSPTDGEMLVPKGESGQREQKLQLRYHPELSSFELRMLMQGYTRLSQGRLPASRKVGKEN